MKAYDVIVIGAGPGGATVARKAAEGGLSVLLLERFKLPRYKACGGGLPYHLHTVLDLDFQPALENVVKKAVFSYRNRFFFRIEPKHLKVEMVLRDVFDAFLVQKAKEAGAEVLDGVSFLDLEERKDAVLVRTTHGFFKARYLVGADGASSSVARRAGLVRKLTYGAAISVEVELPEIKLSRVQDTIYFDVGEIPHGYAWIFPKQHQVSIGVCTALPGQKINDHLDRFMQKSPVLRGGRVLLRCGAPLPFFDSWRPMNTRRVALVGDAAGLVDPLSGEGIHYAIESGMMLAEVLKQNEGLGAYEKLLAERFKEDLEKAKILARAFFAFPQLVFFLGMINPFFHTLFTDLILGKLRYSQLFDRIDKSLWAKLFRFTRRWLFPKATAQYLFH